MKRAFLILLALALLLGGVGQAEAGIINGGFETGDLTGWTANPTNLVSVVTTADAKSATEGTHFALLTAGGQNVYTTLSQTFTANLGDKLSFDAFFSANDYLPYNDDGYVSIIGPSSNVTPLFSSSVAVVGDNQTTPWTSETYTIPTSGTYTIQAGVENVGDNNSPSDLGLDNVQLTSGTLVASAVPEPATVTMLGIGLAGLAGYGVRRRKQRAATA